MDLIQTALVSFSSAFAGSAFKHAKIPGQALDDLLILAGYDKYHLKAQDKRRENYLKHYKESIAKGITEIPEHFLQIPRPIIAGPALEISKYYLGEPELRDLFARLVISSMDSRKNEIVHPSFIEIIKQLSPLDAQLFSKISETLFPKRGIYTADVVIRNDVMGDKVTHKNLFVNHLDVFNNQEQNSIIFSNLNRLGLIETVNSFFISDSQLAERDDLIGFTNTKPYLEAKKAVDFSQEQLAENQDIPTEFAKFISTTGPFLRINSVELSSIGQSFYQTVFDEN